MLNESGLADRPVTTGTETVQEKEIAVPPVKVATTLGVVLATAAITALVGFHANEMMKTVTVGEKLAV